MTDRKKLEIIDGMIGDYYEFCSFDDAEADRGSLRMLIGCIELVANCDDDEEEDNADIPDHCDESEDGCASCENLRECLRENAEEYLTKAHMLVEKLIELEGEDE